MSTMYTTAAAPPREEKKRLPPWLPSPVIPTSLAARMPSDVTMSRHDANQDYLVGVRGVLTIMSFLWVFLQTFAPAAVKGSANTTGPAYQIALRKSLSILFWNDSLIYSSILFLSARTICLPFLLDPTKITLASAVVRRGIRLWLPTAAALIVCYVVFTKVLGQDYLRTFATQTSNVSMSDDLYLMPSSLANFNSLFNLFWITHELSYQAGNWAFPTQTLWLISAVFQQSYTVFATMVVIPFTRTSWRVTAALVFILTAWWVYSWAWFSISGLLLADAVVNMDFKAQCQSHRVRTYVIAGVCLVAGYVMQFIWVAARPDLANAEINYHTGLYNTGGLYTWNDQTAPLLRADNYLVIIGFFLLLESTDWLQAVFRNRVLVLMGKRSYSKSPTPSIHPLMFSS